MRRSILLIGSLLFGLIAYAVYEPMPEYVHDRAFLTVGHALLHFLEAVGQLAEVLGLAQSEHIRRALFSIMLPPVRNTSSVSFTYRQLGRSRTLVASPADPADGSGAAIVFIHGGGWAVGTPEMQNKLYAQLVHGTGAVVFAIRYRLAPEHRFPTAFNDCLAATEAIFESAKSLGVDPSRIAIAGDSAGGQLAASVVQQLRRSGRQYKPKLHVMLYPISQIVNVRTESYLKNANAPILKSGHMHSFISLYLTGSKTALPWIFRHGHVTDEVRAVYEKMTGTALPKVDSAPASSEGVSDSDASLVSSAATDFRVSPLLGNDLEKLDLPPAHILACEFDPLLDDSVMYAKRLEMSGVRVSYRRFHSYHGAASIPTDGREMRDYMIRVFRDEL